MSLLFLILSVMTWTVQSKNTVSGEGTWPYDIEVSYANTYNKGQVRAGDEAVLTLAHLEGIDIQDVTVYVKSNKTSGAGTFTVQSNGEVVATKSGTMEEWTGAYDNAVFHPIPLLTKTLQSVDELSISLVGTTNSLHIDRYEITYSSLAPRNVTLYRGSSLYTVLTEQSAGEGVILPTLRDTAQWHFIGWSEVEIFGTHDMPALYPGGAVYRPAADISLWATYSYRPEPPVVYMTESQSGEYLYVNTATSKALSGIPAEGIMGFSEVNMDDLNQVYWVEFLTPDTALIVHALTGTPIGYKGTNLIAAETPWLVYHQGDETLFYTLHQNQTYVLWLNCMDSGGNSYYAGLLRADLGTSPMKLLEMPMEGCDPLITSHPEAQQALPITTDGKAGERSLMQIGNYELILMNGHKQLRRK